MKKIKRDTHLLITFSKRKSGICKKASELVTMTGCEIGFLVFSPAGKVFTFAYPSFNYIVGRYLGQIYNQHQDPPMPYAMEVFRQARTQQLTNRYTSMLDQYENQERYIAVLIVSLAGKALNNWWNKYIHDVQGGEIEGLANSYMEMWNRIELRLREMMLGMYRFVPTDSINNNDTNVVNVDVVGVFSSGFPHFDHRQSLLQQPVDMVPPTQLMMNTRRPNLLPPMSNMGRPDSFQLFPNMGRPHLVQPMSNMEGPNLLQPLPNMGGSILLQPVPNFSMVGLPCGGSEDTCSFWRSGRTVVVKLRLSVPFLWSDRAVVKVRVLAHRRCSISLICNEDE
ncbi:Agamous-like MADS-box protein AGL62 [Linum grandiflorum]